MHSKLVPFSSVFKEETWRQTSSIHNTSLQCRRINFGWVKPCSCSYCCSRHFWFYDSRRLGRVAIVTLRVGARAKQGQGGGGEEKKKILSLSPHPLPAPFDSPHFLLSSVSTWRFREEKHLPARRKCLHCRLFITLDRADIKWLAAIACNHDGFKTHQNHLVNQSMAPRLWYLFSSWS